MLIPFEQINPDTLESLLETHALQEGTEYGESETSLATKIKQLRNQLEKGHIVIVYDSEMESCNLVTKQHWKELEDKINIY